MANIFGPYGAGINPVTTRPVDTGEPGVPDTFFGPCSSPTTRDGTVVSYRWLNKLLATLRRATRGMGIADDPASDDLLLDAIKRGATLKNVGTQSGALDLYAGQNGVKEHLIRRVAPGSNVQLTLVEGPTGEHTLRISVTAPGSGPTGNTISNVGDGADVYKGTNGTTEELRGIKGASGSPIAAATNGDNIELGIESAAYGLLMRAAGTTGQTAAQTVGSLTAEASPADTDVLLLAKSADSALRKVTVAAVRNIAQTYLTGMVDVYHGSNNIYTKPAGWGNFAYFAAAAFVDPDGNAAEFQTSHGHTHAGVTSGTVNIQTAVGGAAGSTYTIIAFRLT